MKKNVLGAALVLVLAGCGGGDGGSSPPTGGGTPTPTPTTSPTPSPSPSPTPTPTYQTYSQLTGTQTFATVCGGTFNQPGQAGIPVGGAGFNNSQLSRGITIVSDRSQPDYIVSSDGAGLFSTFSTTFTQANRDTVSPGEAYIKLTANNVNERLSIFPLTSNGAELEFLRLASITAEVAPGTTSQNCVFGVPTLVTDVPSTSPTYGGFAIFGVATVRGNGSTLNYRINTSITSLTGNPTTGQISFTLNIIGEQVGGTPGVFTNLGNYQGTATINGTQQGYSDLLLSSDNVVVGNVGGWFFGPQGATAAVSISIQHTRSDDTTLSLGSLLLLRPI